MFFHCWTSNKTIKYHITTLKDDHNNWTTNDHQLGDLLLNYYKDLFKSRASHIQHLDHIPIAPISQSQQDILNAFFTATEIKSTVWKLGTWKAPGLDAIQIGFLKNNWNLVGNSITHLALQILLGSQYLHPYNYTDMVLIPKSQITQTPNDLRPIGLCNTFYKISPKSFLSD